MQILNLLGAALRPLSVGEIVQRAAVRPPTVSHHLKLLADARFVLREREGASVLYSINWACLDALPSVADALSGRPVLSG